MRDKRFYGWYVVAAAHILLMLIFGAAYSFGAFFSQIQSNFDAGRFSVASVFSLTAFLYYLVGVFSGSFADRFSTRGVVVTGILFLAAGFFLSSFATQSLHAFLAVFCLFVGLGVGLVYVPTVTTVQRWFIVRRSTASGIALAGTGLGTFIGPNVAGVLMQFVSWQSTMRIFAVAIALFGVIAAMVLHATPKSLGLHPDGVEQTNTSAIPLSSKGMDLREASGTARFWWYFGAILMGSVGLFLALVHINPFAREMGISGTEANLLIGFVGAGNVGGRLFLGGVGDKIGPKRLLVWLTFSLAVLNGLWLGSAGFVSLAIFAVLFGAANGGCISLYPSVAANWFGTKNLGAILGALYIGVGIAAVAGGSIAGLLFDTYHNYAASIMLSAVCALMSVLFIVCAERSAPAAIAA
jgi:MFS family permease